MTYSLAVGTKMSQLLSAPGLLLLLLQATGARGALAHVALCAAVQAALAAPFAWPPARFVAYLRGAFDFGRVFLHKWTCNWKFVPEDVFVSKGFALATLAATLARDARRRQRRPVVSFAQHSAVIRAIL